MKKLMITIAIVIGTSAMAQEIDGRFLFKSGTSKCPLEIVITSGPFSTGTEVLIESYYDSFSTETIYKSGTLRSGRLITEIVIEGGVITEDIYKKTLFSKKLIGNHVITIKPLGASLKKNDIVNGEKIECKFFKY